MQPSLKYTFYYFFSYGTISILLIVPEVALITSTSSNTHLGTFHIVDAQHSWQECEDTVHDYTGQGCPQQAKSTVKPEALKWEI